MVLFLIMLACGDSTLEEGEWLPGGAATNTLLLGSNSFLRPASNLSAEHEQAFYSGNSFFNQSWVQAPASTENRDGVGPLFNSRSCSGCHFRDGKGFVPLQGVSPLVGILLRLSVPGGEPDPVYGEQLQDQALPDLLPEAQPWISWEELPVTLEDGSQHTLLDPTYHLDAPAYGPFLEDLMVSPRLAPHMVGLGLLEAIPASRLEELADPDDADGDGISGRIHVLETGEIGRFGWKSEQPTVRAQVAGAFAGDMGLTTTLHPVDDCTALQPECTELPDGGAPEVTETLFERTVLYSQAIAPPVRRAADDPEVLEGRQIFRDLGCSSCHVPAHTTGAFELEEFEDERIWPYTDLLLHDMGPGLSDGRPVAGADASEWRTPPLWGIGLQEEVSGEARFLHDGRARDINEAILWHDGEAAGPRQGFEGLSSEERTALIRFVEDL
ncbi:MAG: CxxC motif-containing protein (DUF1111 family) [Cognaticolwellia sp.]|jgi:CxxC motif-containing protein (DUF1111 family)